MEMFKPRVEVLVNSSYNQVDNKLEWYILIFPWSGPKIFKTHCLRLYYYEIKCRLLKIVVAFIFFTITLRSSF